MDPVKALTSLTSKTKACLVVHLYGELVDTDAFQHLAKSEGLLLIEDAAQAHGAITKNREKAVLLEMQQLLVSIQQKTLELLEMLEQ